MKEGFLFRVGDRVYLTEDDGEQIVGEIQEIFTDEHGDQVSLVCKNMAIGASNYIVIDLTKIKSAQRIRSN